MVNDYEPVKPCPTRVYVNGTRIPAMDVDIHLRKEGPLDLNRYADITFASPWNDKDFLSLFDSLTEDPSTDTLRVDSRDQKNSVYTTLFNGVVTAVGDSQNSNRKKHRCRARGPEHYLNRIPASKVFKSPFSTTDILKYVNDELNKNYVLDIGINVEDETFLKSRGLFGQAKLFAQFLFGTSLGSSKSFQQNKHSLADVLAWVKDKLGGRVWIQPLGADSSIDGQFVFLDQPTQQSQSHTAHYLNDGKVRVIDNSSLKEIKPLNQITVNGRASDSFERSQYGNQTITGKEFVQVTARHETLFERNNEKILTDTVFKSDAETKQEVEQEARSILKKRIDEATSGSMETVLPDATIQPYDTITARPTVNGQTVEVPPLTYEVHQCHYQVDTSNNKLHKIDLNCGIHTDINEDISIISSNIKEA